MHQIFEVALLGMQQDAARIERVAMNLANVMTPAYKRELLVTSASAGRSSFGDQYAAIDGAARDPAADPLLAMRTLVDSRPGTLKPTGQPLDVALAGPGYFEVATEAGPAYTRMGNFRLDANSRLVTADGQFVMGKGGAITLTGARPVIDAAGRVSENGRVVDQLQVKGFEHPSALRSLGNGLWATNEAAGAMTPLAEVDIQLRQAYLENSNVNSVHEMVELSRTMRHFEAMHKMAQGYDDLIGLTLQKMGEA